MYSIPQRGRLPGARSVEAVVCYPEVGGPSVEAVRVHRFDPRQRFHCAENGLLERARRCQLCLKVAEFRAIRKPAMPQQEAALFERDALLSIGQVVNVVAVVREHATIAIEIADR